MAEKSTPVWKTSLNFGLITGVIIIIFQLILYLTDSLIKEESSWLNFLVYLILIGGIIWGSKSYRDLHNNGFISYGKAFTTGFLVAFFASVLTAVFTFLLYSMDESLVQEMLLRAEETLYEQNLSEGDIENALKVQKIFVSPPIMALMSLLWMTIISVVLALITSIFIKREEIPA
ncbi:MAG: DUF4199 domain-containing protein [Bacteroidales bacterium]|nr:DUF4199 domain-containing protein [Bacteroidales bacterium]MCF8388379.1 DUF4199 domain-containing protein [Bacteroidales bacterium]MCF8396536.1 DUF4199 domain-containing protein [Bacteroidales bacterium]